MKESINYQQEVSRLVDEAIAVIRDGYDEAETATELAEGSPLTIYAANSFVVIRESRNREAVLEQGCGESLARMNSVPEILSAIAFHALHQDILDGIADRRDEIE
jgi:hypothetical protein